jgi:hypothetical protein
MTKDTGSGTGEDGGLSVIWLIAKICHKVVLLIRL